ncbi:glucose-1-phosphate cytidylyltransferase [Nitrosopumilus sp. b2]|uniref:glucose-1-phosphate cytidylyltransferase n=1 Tax=Nitrosopumilus sp. b2 TaxID=2109908 RepID=UPI0015F72EC2|nr:glucose-1-phosphate cytidylyltransferase [Nitrosopumilus sp. b2]KAF6245759.1 glucose-1-phosphate cytidylyltransferase [Nitrosopumilus sp. b2]
MKAVILAGGQGTRISEETHLKPKPMVEIGGKPILWHILKTYSAYNINEFIICLGYKGYLIKEYFANYNLHESDLTIDIQKNSLEIHKTKADPWKITLIDTGEKSMTGGRIKRITKYLDDTFCLTYGDGLADVNISEIISSHKKNNTLATLTAVQPPGKFGAVTIKDNMVTTFEEKPEGDAGWVNGGFFVLEPQIVDYIEGDDIMFEREPLQQLTKENQLSAYHHKGFWHPMDTLRDKNKLEELWSKGNAPWKVW